MLYPKLNAIKGDYLCESNLSMDSLIAVGFGTAIVTKNGVVIYDEMDYVTDLWTVRKAEEIASKEPEKDWRIHLVAPLIEKHYQRQGNELWVLYKKGRGFA